MPMWRYLIPAAIPCFNQLHYSIAHTRVICYACLLWRFNARMELPHASRCLLKNSQLDPCEVELQGVGIRPSRDHFSWVLYQLGLSASLHPCQVGWRLAANLSLFFPRTSRGHRKPQSALSLDASIVNEAHNCFFVFGIHHAHYDFGCGWVRSR